MNNHLKRLLVAAVIVLSFCIGGVSQKLIISDVNVRAEMNFLASDAMQGRGSGTIFERVAAEYIGSQFMQFGLEPAGENGTDGKPTFIQTVLFKSKRTGAEGKTWNAMGKISRRELRAPYWDRV